jgi:hypothetical protein
MLHDSGEQSSFLMGYLIDPPRHVEGDYVAIFTQTDAADALAAEFLRSRGIDVKELPLMGDLAFNAFGSLGSAGLFGTSGLVCVPADQADEALDLLEFDSGLVED